MIIKDMPGNERPREKLLEYGAKHLSNSELLAILLRTGTKEKSAITLAHEILAKEQRGLYFLAQALPEELAEIHGIGQAKACQILAALELGRRVAARPSESRDSVTDPESVALMFMEEMRNLNRENFKLLTLNCKGEVISRESVAVGDLTSAIVHPREVFNSAVRKSAKAVILVHNHPSGSTIPSKEDINITKRLKEAGDILGIEVLDHIIIGDGQWLSFNQKNIL